MKVNNILRLQLEKSTTDMKNILSNKYASMVLALDRAIEFHSSFNTETDDELIQLTDLRKKCKNISDEIDSIYASVQIDDDDNLISPIIHNDSDDAVFVSDIIKSLLSHNTEAIIIMTNIRISGFMDDINLLKELVSGIYTVLIHVLAQNKN